MRQASSTELPEAFTRLATLDRPGRLGARSLHWVARSDGLCTNSQKPSPARSTGLFETLSLSHELLAACLLFPLLLGIMFLTDSDLRQPCHPPPSQTHNRSDQGKPHTERPKQATETHQRTRARPRQPCGCLVLFVSSLPFDFTIHRETFLFLRFFC